MVRANCSCFNSIPSPSMIWFINGQAVHYPNRKGFIKTILYTTTGEEGLLNTVLHIRIKLKEKHFKVRLFMR